ncbi:HEAT repeat domain-containing protein [Gemmata sp. JC673]|uniref:HEAT repeat domain-containing protein n=1 Tax=Gemmata algarum TaxID=2975278 RepID=A0ABU5ET55_9BACT|nr:HEAT repeat domain-containing protein [Gemmata algarum]MDY3557655.1 HEAT repeat domain-containing protein [Gemmata algarum]
MVKWLARVLGLGIASGVNPQSLARQVRASDPELRRRAADQLAAVSEPWAAELLLVLFKDMSGEVRAAARDGFRHQGTAATSALIKALEDADPRVAVPAAELLGEVKDLDAVRPLLLVMKFGAPETRAAATRALIRYGRSAIPGLLLACDDPDPWTRTRGEEVLAAIRLAEHTAATVEPPSA